jgi:PAS domain S-box-containing protein
LDVATEAHRTPLQTFPLIREAVVRELLYDSPVALLVVDDDARVLIANDAALALMGYALDELRGRQPWGVARDGATSIRTIDEILLGGRLASTTLIRHKDGRDIPCSYFAWATTVTGMSFIAMLLWADG